MFEKLKMSIKSFVIGGLIVMLGLPLSLFMVGVKPAQASVKSKTVVAEPVVKSAAISKLSFVGQPQGLVKANTYVAGQSISMTVTLSDSPVSVWTEIGSLDPTFPEILYFSAQGQGKWNLKTPVLSSNLNLGGFALKVFAQANDGKIVQTQVKITLQQFKVATVSSYKVSGDGVANIAWSPINWADAYLISWQIQGNNSSNKTETTKLQTITLKNLEPGTFYEVKIQPLRGEAVGPATKLFIKTFGVAPKEVVGESQASVAPRVTPQITPQAVSTEKVAQKASVTQVTPKVESTSTPTPTPSSSAPTENAKTTAGGWSKLLIALSILIIAAGAAIGGYYGYEWLMLKGKDKEPPESSSRW